MQLSCSKDHILTRLLLEAFDARVGLTKKLQPTNKFWEIGYNFNMSVAN
jgi:hypothetical protein